MISILFILPYDEKNGVIRRCFEAEAERLGLGQVHTAEWNSASQPGAAYTARAHYQIAVLDITLDRGLELAQSLRRSDSSLLLLVIADMKISPMKYMKPSVRAQALLLKPWTVPVLKQVTGDFLSLYAEQDEPADKGASSLLVEYDGEKRVIPYKDILYVEARSKKVYVRTLEEEYGMYGTLDRLEEVLPSYFFRCHRSYIINDTMLVGARLAENTLCLQGQVYVPVSRTYKPLVREKMNGSVY